MNTLQFAHYSNVHLLLGDSGKALPKAISLATGRILFWLDGHFSGTGTGMGDTACPIIQELRLIAKSGRKGDVIVIDDRRLFTGIDGYPTLEEAICEIKAIDQEYKICEDGDAIVAVS